MGSNENYVLEEKEERNRITAVNKVKEKFVYVKNQQGQFIKCRYHGKNNKGLNYVSCMLGTQVYTDLVTRVYTKEEVDEFIKGELNGYKI